jgi:hypothetical protein
MTVLGDYQHATKKGTVSRFNQRDQISKERQLLHGAEDHVLLSEKKDIYPGEYGFEPRDRTVLH